MAGVFARAVSGNLCVEFCRRECRRGWTGRGLRPVSLAGRSPAISALNFAGESAEEVDRLWPMAGVFSRVVSGSPGSFSVETIEPLAYCA